MSVRVSPEIAIIPGASIRAVPQPEPPARGRRAARPAPAAPRGARHRRRTTRKRAGRRRRCQPRALPQGWTVDAAAADGEVLARGRSADGALSRCGPPRQRRRPASTTSRRSSRRAARRSTRGYQVIEYPHIRRAAHLRRGATSTLKVIDVKTAPNLTRRLHHGRRRRGAGRARAARASKVEMLERRRSRVGQSVALPDHRHRRARLRTARDLRANNSRLLDYVHERRHADRAVQQVRVQRRRSTGRIRRRSARDRVTDEYAPVQVLEPARSACSTRRTRLTDATWKSWVQERGLYFLGEHDSRYRDLVALEDPFPYNKGEKRGALVEAQYGKGRWVYVGLGLWRELPCRRGRRLPVARESHQPQRSCRQKAPRPSDRLRRLAWRRVFRPDQVTLRPLRGLTTRAGGTLFPDQRGALRCTTRRKTLMPFILDPQLEHLLRRAGFGARPDELDIYRARGRSTAPSRAARELRARSGRCRQQDRQRRATWA